MELLKTESLNPLYPKGKPLTILESIPFSYRFLQGLVDKSSADPDIRYIKVIDALIDPQKYIPGYYNMIELNVCKPGLNKKPAFLSSNIRQWVYCYFERIGQMIVLENNLENNNSNNSPACPCVEGKFMHSDVTDIIELLGTRGQLSLTAGCDLIFKLNTKLSQKIKVGHVDSPSGQITLTDENGKSIDVSALTNRIFFSREKITNQAL